MGVQDQANQIIECNHRIWLVLQDRFVLRDCRSLVTFENLQAGRRQTEIGIVGLLFEASLDHLNRSVIVFLANIELGNCVIAVGIFWLLGDRGFEKLQSLIAFILRQFGLSQEYEKLRVVGIFLDHIL